MSTFKDDDTERMSPKRPVSAHPAFPAIVASWFAALLGLGSLILPVALLERLAAATGLAVLVPSAAAPLGFAARASIAAVAAIVGAILGLSLARLIARGRVPKHHFRHAEDDAPPRRPISAHDELGEAGIDSEGRLTAGARRRRFAIAAAEAPSLYPDEVPLPGDEGTFDEPVSELLDPDFIEPDGPLAAHEDQENALIDEPEPGPSDTGTPETASGEASPTLSASCDPLPAPETGEGRGEAQALSFTAPSLHRGPVSVDPVNSRELPQQTCESEPVETTPTFKMELGKMELGRNCALGGAGLPAKEHPLDQLGLVQLVARLGSAIERRRALCAGANASHTGFRDFTAEEDFCSAEAEKATRARAHFFGAPAQSPAALHRSHQPAQAPFGGIDFGGDDDDSDMDDFSASFSLPLRSRLGTGSEDSGHMIDEYDEEEEDPAAEQRYCSLLAMKNPFLKTAELARLEEPEPNEGWIEGNTRPAGKPHDAEHELRSALESPQRMSGTV